MTMKLACLRCKRKKIKCDKDEPICHQCMTAKAECQYVERRQRPRLAQQKVAVQHLNQRLELLERHISHADDSRSPSTPLPTIIQRTARDISPVPSPEASLTVGDGQESWIYRLATDTRRSFQNQATPVATPTPRIDDAMMSLNEALEDLGNLRVRTDLFNVELRLSPAESSGCIEAFAKMMSTMVVPDIFTASLDINLLRTLPKIIDSPYINIDPGLRVMYYSALYYGLQQTRGPGSPLVQAAYRKVLEDVPAWLEASTGTDMDGHTAALTAWTAINNHDYQLSWKFHCKSCYFIKLRGIDQLDVKPAKTFEEEDKKDILRYLYWHILSTDTFFRLFYGKPTVVSSASAYPWLAMYEPSQRFSRDSGSVMFYLLLSLFETKTDFRQIRWSPNKIRPPALFRVGNMHPSAAQVTVAVIWVRYTLMTAEMINFIDEDTSHDRDKVIADKVDEFCLQLEELMVEFKLEPLMNAKETQSEFRCLLADHVMNIYVIIIGMQRLAKRSEPRQPVDTISVRAARKVVNILLNFNNDPSLPDESRFVFDHFITLYPFCAVFSLYEYILACNDPEDCEIDIQMLEDIGTLMAQSCAQRRNFLPFVKTIDALNKVSRSLQDEKRKYQSMGEQGASALSQQQGFNLPVSTFDDFRNLVANELPQFDAATFPSLPDLSMALDGDFHPLGFVRALENDFQNRNWHNNWWDLSGGDGEMLNIPENGQIHQSPFALPTPNTT